MAKTGVRGKWGAEIKNLNAMKSTFKDISRAVGERLRGTYQFKKAGQSITEGYEQAALLIRNTARRNAQAGGVPRRIYEGGKPAIFAFFDWNAATDQRRQQSSMVGVRTGLATRTKDPRLFINWGHGQRRRKDNTISDRGISMSFGALFERGTRDKRITGVRYFRRAINQTRGQVIAILKNGYAGAFSYIQSKFNQN